MAASPQPEVQPSPIEDRSATLRLRTAYMYYVERMTQSDIADRLGIGRVTVVRYLREARRRHEVRFWIEHPLAECIALEQQLQERFALERAVVVPDSGEPTDANRLVGFRAGIHVSELIEDGMSVGVGWGSTLLHALSTLSNQDVMDTAVVSLLGGIYHAREYNPSEFAWRVANAVGADCYMFTAPAVVNSEATRAALLDECGLQALVRRARNVDVAVLSVGSMHPDATTFRYGRGMLPSDARKELIEAGAVGNMCFHFFDAEGRPVEHPINRRVMSVPIGDLHGVRHRLLVSGGEQKVEAIRAGMKLLDANVLITNESAARTLVERA